jgi:hypothetical protein
MTDTNLNTHGCLDCIETDLEKEGVKWRLITNGQWQVANQGQADICNRFAKVRKRYEIEHIIRLCIDLFAVSGCYAVNSGIKMTIEKPMSIDDMNAKLYEQNLFAERRNTTVYIVRPLCPIFKKPKKEKQDGTV